MPNAFDLLIIAGLALAFAGGWQLGFVTRATSWLGLALGLALGARSLPWIVDRLAGAPPLRLFMTLGMVLLALGSLGLVVGMVIGNRLRFVVSGTEVHPVDRFFGGLTSCLGLLVVVWLIVPLMVDVSQWPAEQARGSRIARGIAWVFPEAPDSIQALGRVVGEQHVTRVLDAFQRTPQLVAPPSESGLTDELIASVTRSVVRVEGVACRRIQVGSGFVIGDGLVVTNAHVVSGETTTRVRRDDGLEFDAVAVLFDPARDLAVLAVSGLDREPLVLDRGAVGDIGAVFGYPAGGELRVAPFEVGRHLTATGRDIYNDQRVSRDVYFIASDLASGDSGAALVRPDGKAIGIAFAVAPDREAAAYALTSAEVSDALDTDLSQRVETGACL